MENVDTHFLYRLQKVGAHIFLVLARSAAVPANATCFWGGEAFGDFSVRPPNQLDLDLLLCRQFTGQFCNTGSSASKESPRILLENPSDLLIRHSGRFDFGQDLLEQIVRVPMGELRRQNPRPP